MILPNEVIHSIFDFLKTSAILQAFTQLNRRYDDLVRLYIKRIDLNDGWEGDLQDLKWICRSVQTLRINQNFVHLLDDPDYKKSVAVSPIQKYVSQPHKIASFRSTIKRLFTRSPKTTTSSGCCRQRTPREDYQFPQLHSLYLVNVSNWTKMISNMNLESLSLYFDDDDDDHYCEKGLIPQTLIQFSANTVIETKSFHTNLIDLDVCIRSMVQLLEMVERIPRLQRLSITFADSFHDHYCIQNDQSSHFEIMAIDFHPLSNLNRLSFSTKQTNETKSNERLPFDQIRVFIDQCCPNKSILKKVTLKFDSIMFDKNMWSTIVRYKNTFGHFDFYASFIAEDKASTHRIIPSNNDHFDYHLEDGDPLHAQARFVHIYSLPFGFDKLHGFISCSELSSRPSFLNVRYLYLTKTRLARPISFELLTKRMPHLISIDCNFSFAHGCGINVSPLIFDQDIFNYVRFFRFTSYCRSTDCVCFTLLPRLLDRMPRLQSLTTSVDALENAWHPLPPIK